MEPVIIDGKKMIKKYRLVLGIQTEIKGYFSILLADQIGEGGIAYPDFRDEWEFDSEEEALHHAMKNPKWYRQVFTVLPLYYISET